jgi:DNA mismatch endonuclease (patch repair protein)
MTDVFSKAKRSEVMARIRSRGNKATELEFMKLLRRHHISGWRRHLAITLPKSKGATSRSRCPRVRPDFVFPKSKVAIFVDGCFWHGCPIHCAPPSSNSDFWSEKLAINKKRDLNVNRRLRRKHWSVFRFWEHQLNDGARLESRLRTKLKSRNALKCDVRRTFPASIEL